MRLSAVVGLLLLSAISSLAADEEPKKQPTPKPEKKPNPVFTKASDAGPDFAMQGEYVGEIEGKGKAGFQIIARGDGKFSIRALHGGLPGDGWDGVKQNKFEAVVKDGKLKFGDAHAQAVVENGKIMVTSEAGNFTANRVVRKSPTEGMKPPTGATVLFDGSNLDGWTKGDGKSAATWLLGDGGTMQVKGGDIRSKARFGGSFHLHVEFYLPFMPKDGGQGRANSGVYIQNRYELQVLDSFGLAGKDNEAGGFYQAYDPKVNMCFPPLQWQTYDIEFTAAKFENGKKVKDATCTVKHNGVVVQDNVALKKPTPGGVAEADTPEGIRLQDHGNPVMYRNIWVAEKK